MIKQIVLQVGRKIIDFFAWFDLVIISILLIFGVFAISVVDYEFYIKVFMTIGALVIAIILFMVSILCKYFTYLFIDIRDNTAKMTNNDENTEELNKSISKVLKALGITVITVIVVGLFISVVDYTQRTLHNQVGNFKITTLNKSIKNKNKYSDTKSFKRYGFKYSAEDNKQLKILAITPNSNADKAGIKVGDVFLKGGSPGHVVMILDVCENELGEKAYLLAQGYMPAQEFHILKNPLHENDPWYYESEITYPLRTPEYTFPEGSLKRLNYE